MNKTERIHRVWVNGHQVENYKLMCDVCLSYQSDEMLMGTKVQSRQEWRNGSIHESHTILLVGCDCWMVEHHVVTCRGEDQEQCCEVTSRDHTVIPAGFLPVMMRYQHLPRKLQEESDAMWRDFDGQSLGPGWP